MLYLRYKYFFFRLVKVTEELESAKKNVEDLYPFIINVYAELLFSPLYFVDGIQILHNIEFRKKDFFQNVPTIGGIFVLTELGIV